MANETKQKEEPKKNEKESRFYIGEVPTQTKPVIVDRKNDLVLDELQALIKIMNDIEEIKKNIVSN